MGMGEKASPLSEVESLSIALEEAGIIICEFWVSVTHTHTHTHTHRNVHSCSCSWTHIHKTYVHTHSYTWMHTNSSTIDGKQNHMFLHNHIHGQNHILHRPNTLRGPWSSLLLRWKSASQTELMGTSFFRMLGSYSMKNSSGDFPGGPVVKTLFLHSSGHGVNAWLGNKILHATWWGRKI